MTWRELERRISADVEINDLLDRSILSEEIKCFSQASYTSLFSGGERSSFPWNFSEDRRCPQWQFPWNSGAFGTLRSTVAGAFHKSSTVTTEEGTSASPLYLSADSQNEFIALCADYVRKCILQELKQAQCYSIMVDATPDTSHTEQTTFVLRYFLEETGEFVIKERFLTLVEYCEKTGAGIATLIVNALNDFEIPFANCHGQGYGNAENVCCKYNGTLTKSVHLTSARYLKTHA